MNEIFDLLGLGGIGMSSPTWDVSEQQFIESVGPYNHFGKRMMEAERQQAMHDFVGPTGRRYADQAASQQRIVDAFNRQQERAAECWQCELIQQLDQAWVSVPGPQESGERANADRVQREIDWRHEIDSEADYRIKKHLEQLIRHGKIEQAEALARKTGWYKAKAEDDAEVQTRRRVESDRNRRLAAIEAEYEQRIAAIKLKYARRRRQIDRKYRNRFKLWRTAGLVLRWWWKRQRPARPAGYEKGRRFEVKRRLTDVERAYWGVE